MDTDADFDGRTIAVTGGAGGIGRELVLMLASAGAQPVAADRDSEALAALARDATTRGLSITTIQLDVADARAVSTLIDASHATGGIDGLVCAAGIVAPTSFLELTAEQWDRTQTINLRGTFLVCQAVARSMVERGTATGTIVTMASGMAVNGPANHADYAASKAGVIGLTRSMARALSPHGIRVNCVAPGPIDTPMLPAAIGNTPLDALPTYTAAGVGSAVDVASVLMFFLSGRSAWVSGQTVHVNGGTGMY